jgi:hypothetical protein
MFHEDEYKEPPKMQIGAPDKLPHAAVIGTPDSFYVWLKTDDDVVGEPSARIKGAAATSLFASFKHLFKANQAAFIEKCREAVYTTHKWAPSPGPSWKVCDIATPRAE